MANKQKKIDTPACQLSLLEHLENVRREKMKANSIGEGSASIIEPLQRALNLSIKQSNLSRHQIAGEMSHLVGVEITKAMIDAWTAASKTAWRMPAEYIPAFCLVTKNNAALDVINEAAGNFAIPGPEALRAEMARYAADEKRARKEKNARKILLDQLENGCFTLPGNRRNGKRRIND